MLQWNWSRRGWSEEYEDIIMFQWPISVTQMINDYYYYLSNLSSLPQRHSIGNGWTCEMGHRITQSCSSSSSSVVIHTGPVENPKSFVSNEISFLGCCNWMFTLTRFGISLWTQLPLSLSLSVAPPTATFRSVSYSSTCCWFSLVFYPSRDEMLLRLNFLQFRPPVQQTMNKESVIYLSLIVSR